MDTRAVVEHHLEALQAGDLEATMDDYTEESVLLLPGMVLKGLEQLRGVFAQALETNFKPGAAEFILETFDVEEDHALITWHQEAAGAPPFWATDTFMVRDGKIVVH